MCVCVPEKWFLHIQTNFFYLLMFGQTPPVKLKLGLQISERLLITAHLDQSNYVPSQYDLTVLIRLFSGSESSVPFSVLQEFFGANPLDSTRLLYLIQDFQCSRVTYWVPVEMLLGLESNKYWVPVEMLLGLESNKCGFTSKLRALLITWQSYISVGSIYTHIIHLYVCE